MFTSSRSLITAILTVFKSICTITFISCIPSWETLFFQNRPKPPVASRIWLRSERRATTQRRLPRTARPTATQPRSLTSRAKQAQRMVTPTEINSNMASRTRAQEFHILVSSQFFIFCYDANFQSI